MAAAAAAVSGPLGVRQKLTECMQVSLMDEAGNTKDDLSLPKGTDDADKLAEQIQADFAGGKELVVTVLKVSHVSCCPQCLLSCHMGLTALL